MFGFLILQRTSRNSGTAVFIRHVRFSVTHHCRGALSQASQIHCAHFRFNTQAAPRISNWPKENNSRTYRLALRSCVRWITFALQAGMLMIARCSSHQLACESLHYLLKSKLATFRKHSPHRSGTCSGPSIIVCSVCGIMVGHVSPLRLKLWSECFTVHLHSLRVQSPCKHLPLCL
jgi:hypothetical protein